MKIIFHHPGNIGERASAGSLRPQKIYEEFKKRRYSLELISGGIKSRYFAMKQISKKMAHGETYDYIYVENSSSPMFYSSFKFLGRTLFFPNIMDALFFLKCRRNKIPIGYFFRDIYWDFPETLGSNFSKSKLLVLKFFGFLELQFIKYFIDKIFVPNEAFGQYLRQTYRIDSSALPPGCRVVESQNLATSGDKLQLFYVGGCGPVYNPTIFFKAMEKCKDIAQLTFCTRQDEWSIYGPNYDLPDNVNIVHKKGDCVTKEMIKAQICIHTFPPSPYSKIAYPYKIAEYIGYGKPILVIEGTYVSSVVRENSIGFTAPATAEGIADVLRSIASNPDCLTDARRNCERYRETITWGERISYMESELLA